MTTSLIDAPDITHPPGLGDAPHEHDEKRRPRSPEEDRDHRAKTRMERYYHRLNRGLCPGCGGHRNGEGIQCVSCRQKNRQSQRHTRTTERSTRYQMTLIRSRRRQGMCAYCGQERDEPEFKMCSKCRRRQVARWHRDPQVRIKQALNQKPAPPVPLCRLCGQQHRQCSCGKYMSSRHTFYGCVWTCKCGEVHYRDKYMEVYLCQKRNGKS